MNYQTTTRKSYGSKLKSSLFGMIISPVIIIACIFLLGSNEFRAVERTKAIKEGQKIVTSINLNAPLEENNNSFIYGNGTLSSGLLQEPDMNFSIDAIRLYRTVEMYQWNEHSDTKTKENLGGSETQTTTYTYSQQWSGEKIDSSRFAQSAQHQNPSLWAYTSSTIDAENIQAGAFTLSSELKKYLPEGILFPLGEYVTTPLSDGQIIGNEIFIGNDLNNPQVGDLKISYTYIPQSSELSLLAKQESTSVLNIFSLTSKQTLSKIKLGIFSSDELFDELHSDNNMMTWILRGIFTIGIFVGFFLLFNIIPIISSVVPFIGKVLRFGVFLFAFVTTIIVSLTTIAISWFAARPLVSIVLILIVVGIILFIKKHKTIS